MSAAARCVIDSMIQVALFLSASLFHLSCSDEITNISIGQSVNHSTLDFSATNEIGATRKGGIWMMSVDNLCNRSTFGATERGACLPPAALHSRLTL
jgi:hypothetical protein